MILSKTTIFIIVYGAWVFSRISHFMKFYEDINDNLMTSDFAEYLPDFTYYPMVFIATVIKIIALPTIVMGVIYLFTF